MTRLNARTLRFILMCGISQRQHALNHLYLEFRTRPPELQFFMDDSIAHGAHILDLLNHVKPANPANADIVLPEDKE